MHVGAYNLLYYVHVGNTHMHTHTHTHHAQCNVPVFHVSDCLLTFYQNTHTATALSHNTGGTINFIMLFTHTCTCTMYHG